MFAAANPDVLNALNGAQSTVTEYAGVALTAVVALSLFGAGIRIAPRIIRLIASKVAG
jgi:hypothetical protein